MNRTILLGRLTKDPEIRYTNDNLCIARFTVAVNRSKKDAGSDFIPCKAFGKTAEVLEKYFFKGSPICLEGAMTSGSYKNKEGKTVYTLECNASRIEFVSGGKKNDGAEPDAPAVEEQMTGFEAIDDDIPF